MNLKKTCSALLVTASIPLTVSAELPKELIYKEVSRCPVGMSYYYLTNFNQEIFVSDDVMLSTNLTLLKNNKFELYVEERTDVIVNPPFGSDYAFYIGRSKIIKGHYEEKDGEVILEGVGMGTIVKPEEFYQLKLDLDFEVFDYTVNTEGLFYRRASTNHSYYSKATKCN